MSCASHEKRAQLNEMESFPLLCWASSTKHWVWLRHKAVPYQLIYHPAPAADNPSLNTFCRAPWPLSARGNILLQPKMLGTRHAKTLMEPKQCTDHKFPTCGWGLIHFCWLPKQQAHTHMSRETIIVCPQHQLANVAHHPECRFKLDALSFMCITAILYLDKLIVHSHQDLWDHLGCSKVTIIQLIPYAWIPKHTKITIAIDFHESFMCSQSLLPSRRCLIARVPK